MARTLDTVGCEFGRMYKLQFENFETNVNKRFDGIEKSQSEILAQNKDLYNHQSSRWPPVAAWSLTVVGTLLGAAIMFVFMRLFN